MTFIMHEKSMDICFEITKVRYSDRKKYVYKGFWVNLGYTGNPIRIDGPRTITINATDLNKWKQINPMIKRTNSGRP